MYCGGVPAASDLHYLPVENDVAICLGHHFRSHTDTFLLGHSDSIHQVYGRLLLRLVAIPLLKIQWQSFTCCHTHQTHFINIPVEHLEGFVSSNIFKTEIN